MDLINATLIFSAILIVASLSGFISEKAGVVNVAIEGFMIIGALLFKIFGGLFRGDENFYTFIFAALLAALITAAFALLHGFMTIKLKANHVVAGTAINLFASGIALFLSFQIAPLFEVNNGISSFQLIYDNYFVDGNKQQFQFLNIIYFVIALIIASSIFTYFKYTKFGIRHAGVGENPNAMDSAGVNVYLHKWVAVIISGFLAGLAGSFTMAKIPVFNGNVQGLGFVALAIMILGQWRVSIMVIVSFAFAFLYSVADKYVFEYFPKDLMKALPFILSLVALVGLSKFQNMPKANGIHFDKSKR